MRTFVVVLGCAAAVLAAAPATARQAVIAPTENLIVEGIPPIADWHPTRREILVATRFGKRAQFHRVRAVAFSVGELAFTNPPTEAGQRQSTR